MSGRAERAVRIEAARLGAMVEISDARMRKIEVEAPRGHVWGCDTSIHVLVSWQERGGGDDGWADLVDRMSHGVAACADLAAGYCEYCMDPAWDLPAGHPNNVNVD